MFIRSDTRASFQWFISEVVVVYPSRYGAIYEKTTGFFLMADDYVKLGELVKEPLSSLYLLISCYDWYRVVSGPYLQ